MLSDCVRADCFVMTLVRLEDGLDNYVDIRGSNHHIIQVES